MRDEIARRARFLKVSCLQGPRCVRTQQGPIRCVHHASDVTKGARGLRLDGHGDLHQVRHEAERVGGALDGNGEGGRSLLRECRVGSTSTKRWGPAAPVGSAAAPPGASGVAGAAGGAAGCSGMGISLTHGLEALLAAPGLLSQAVKPITYDMIRALNHNQASEYISFMQLFTNSFGHP